MSLADEEPKSTSISSSSSSSALFSKPSLIVFDLDNTLWEPELYKLRKLERQGIQPVAGTDVTLFPAIESILQDIRSSDDDTWSNTKFAIASRTKSVAWAHDLLVQFGLRDFFDYIEIFPGDKKTHFQNLKENSGVDYSDMLFFDDNRDGRFGNCVPVSQLGVLSVHCPGGLHSNEIWTNALENFREWKKAEAKPNTIIEWDGSMSVEKEGVVEKGVVKMVNEQKRFGFIKYGGRKNTRDIFFHFSALPDRNVEVREGDQVSFQVVNDSKKGKNAADKVQITARSTSAPTNGATGIENKDTVEMRVFSMNLPFAALLANEYKTLETRNGTMFTPYPEGTKMLLHVGQRIYPDGDRHIDVMRSGNLSDDEIKKLKSLPEGFGKGMAVAIVEIGETFETTLEQRSEPEFQRNVAAFGADSGMRATVIKRVSYLKKGVRVSGKGGVFKAHIEKDVIPDGWV
jgi:magnesium-dependent phosphatase 1